MTSQPSSTFAMLRRIALLGGVGMLVIAITLAFFMPQAFFRGYLFAWIFWAGITLGSLALAMLQYLTGGKWGHAIRRPLEAAFLVLPVLCILFVPLLFGLHHIYPWAVPGYFGTHHFPHKEVWLNTGSYALRTAIYFILLLPIIFLLRSWSAQQDSAPAAEPGTRLRRLSGGGLIVYVICMVFASTDWVMSLEPEWFSTMFNVIFIITQVLSSLSLAVAVVALLGRFEPFAPILTDRHYHDLGNLLLAFTVFWTYVSFSQFLIIWAGNLPKEISWYIERRGGGWQYLAVFLAITQFGVPFSLLLSRAAKRNRERLAPIALLIFSATIANVYWLIVPSFPGHAFRLHIVDVAAWLGIGGIWAAVYLWALGSRPLLAVYPEGNANA